MTSEPAQTRNQDKIHLTAKDIDPAPVLCMYAVRDTPLSWIAGIFSSWHVSQIRDVQLPLYNYKPDRTLCAT